MRAVSAQKKTVARVRVIDPGDLLTALMKTRILRLRDGISFVVHQVRTRGRGPDEHPLEQLRTMSDNEHRDS